MGIIWAIRMADVFYVSITGLQLKRVWHAPTFWRHAAASMAQAKAAQGCLSADARTINGVHHTLTVWTSREAMQRYLSDGAHLNAMKAFKSFATGKVYGFEGEEVPEWHMVHRLWHDNGRQV